MDDLRLLREYARTGSNAAFEQVVWRHIDLVYGVCLRHLRHAHDAEDATQVVFIHLAREAGRFREGTVLAAWLHHVARLQAAQHVRKASVRRKHEMAAACQPNQQPQTESPADFEIDKALSRLRAGERAAILLRFFQGRSFPEVGRELRISEEAARKRVSRGLEKLRGILRPIEGSALSAAAIEALLHSSAHAAPPALVAATMKAVSAKAAAAAATAAMGKGAIITMTLTKTKAVVICAAALLLVTGGSIAVTHYVGHGREDIVPIRGPLPGTVAAVPPAATQPAYDGPPVAGVAQLADGTPVAGASVFASDPEHFLSLYGTEHLAPPRLIYGTIHVNSEGAIQVQYGKDRNAPLDVPVEPMATTGADGHFQFTPTRKPIGLVVRGEQGIGIATAADVTSGHPIIVKPWARIEGDNRIGTQPVPKVQVAVQTLADLDLLNAAQVSGGDGVTSDANGHFVIPRVIPGAVLINRTFSYHGDVYLGRGGKIEFAKFPPIVWLMRVVDAPAGRTTTVPLGGVGRLIVGRAAQRLDTFAFRRGTFSADPPLEPSNSFPFDFAEDGTFTVPDMPAGKYHLHADFASAVPTKRPLAYRFLKYEAYADADFVVPPISGARGDEPFDVGQLAIKLLPQLSLGQPPPEIDLRAPDGSSIHLRDFRGKYLLLQIWTQGRRYLEREQLRLRAIRDRFGADGRLAMLGVNLDEDAPKACEDATTKRCRWPQAMVAVRGLPPQYQNSGSSLYLLDPQGSLVAKDLDEATAYGMLEHLLGPGGRTDAVVRVEHESGSTVGAQTPYHDVPAPSPDTASIGASVVIVDGTPDGNSGPPHRLIDGRMPSSPDAPGQCFFFNTGTLEGRLRLDLPQPTTVRQINTYSWHTSTRAPQVYRLYASDGFPKSFDPAPKIGTDPLTCGWTLIASVDSRPSKGSMGGRHAVSISSLAGGLGRYRHLLFVVFPTETNDEWGNTFYGEINVIGAP